MPRYLAVLFFAAFIFNFNPTIYTANGSEKSANPIFDRLFSRKGNSFAQGFVVVSVLDNKVLYQHNETQVFNPASVTKLLTSAALLHYFGPTFRFSTDIGHTGTLSKGTISGSLVIRGDGDPLILSETLWELSANLSHLGIKNVKGGILIDNSLFEGEFRQGLREQGQSKSNHSYDSPVTAFGVNFNTVAVAVAPAEHIGSPAKVSLDPYPSDATILDNQVRTVAKDRRLSIRASRISLTGGKSKIILTGQIPLDHRIKKIYRSVNDPIVSSGELLRSFLEQHGIKVSGKISSGRVSRSSSLIKIKSKPLSRIIHDLNFYSNNYIADVTIKRLGAYRADSSIKTSGSYAKGLALLNKFLKHEVGLSDTFNLENGSGLSQKNRISAKQTTQVLAYIARRWDLFPDFLASLPTAGKTGTLKDRFSTRDVASLQGMIRAKTGTLTTPFSVSAMAGYTYHKKHGLLAFAHLQNGLGGIKQPGIGDLQKSQELALMAVKKYL